MVYICYERGAGWYVGPSRRWSERQAVYRNSQDAFVHARAELGGTGGLISHYDVNGFLQGQERVPSSRPQRPDRRGRLSSLAMVAI